MCSHKFMFSIWNILFHIEYSICSGFFLSCLVLVVTVCFFVFVLVFSGCTGKDINSCPASYFALLPNVPTWCTSRKWECLFWGFRFWYFIGSKTPPVAFRSKWTHILSLSHVQKLCLYADQFPSFELIFMLCNVSTNERKETLLAR